MWIRPRLAMAILGLTVPFLINCALIGTTAALMVYDENPLFVVISITLSLCVTLVVIKAIFHLWTELAGPLETGPARRATAKDANMDQEATVPMAEPTVSHSSSIFTRPTTPIPPPSPPLPSPPSRTPRTHVVRSGARCDLATDV